MRGPRRDLSIAAWLVLATMAGSSTNVAGAERATKITTKDGSVMVLVPAGEVVMGDDSAKTGEQPRKKVNVAAFYIDKLEVSNAKYRKFLAWVETNSDRTIRHPDQPPGKDHTPRYWNSYRPVLLRETGVDRLQHFNDATFRKPDHPVVGLDWYDAYAFARWASKRLPREAEWEKAARGTDGRTWPWGNEWDFAKCNSGGYEWKGERDGFIYTAPADHYGVGSSPYGCLNMAGNVWEWTAESSRGSSRTRFEKVIKGGGSNSYPSWVRPAARKVYEADFRYFCLGFRCAMNAAGEEEEQ